MTEFFKNWGVPMVNMPVLALSAADIISIEQALKELLQIVLLLGTIVFTGYQIVRLRAKIKREANEDVEIHPCEED